jgi:Xaa-Pro aminopeptidase
MRPTSLQPAFYQNNRKRLAEKLADKSVAVFHSNHQMPSNADGTMPFIQNSDLFYLTGIDQEETILVLSPDSPNPKMREVLYIRYADEHVLTWEGHKLSKEQAKQISGIETVVWSSEFDKVFRNQAFENENIYLNTNEHKRADNQVKNKDEQFILWCKEQFPLHTFKRLAPLMHELRTFKQAFEVQQITTACGITKKGFERAAKFLKPDVFEYEIEAELIHEFVRNGSKGFAYQPIIASGADSCVLHYISNHKRCVDGDIVLLDIAAEYGNYKSDLTRVLPVNGVFNPRQKAVYQSVLNMLNFAKELLIPGTDFADYNKAVAEKAEEELVHLGLVSLDEIKNQPTDKPVYRKYFMHGVSHFLGLDVHDVGNMSGKMQAGMLLTCEPGIYVKNENIGIRLENNILISETGNIDLMANIPIEIEEIEDLMRNSKN